MSAPSWQCSSAAPSLLCRVVAPSLWSRMTAPSMWCRVDAAFLASMHVFTQRALRFIVRNPFRAKHHVAVQYMARWTKYPLPPLNSHPLPQPPSPCPDPPPLDPPCPQNPLWKIRRTRKNWRHYRQGTSHCSCLEHCFLFHMQHRTTHSA